MAVRRGFLACALLVGAGAWSVNWVVANVEVATLHTRGAIQEHYTRVFVVDDDGPVVWVRAERPDRLWLKALRRNPDVILRRAGRDVPYRAVPWNGTGGHQRIDALFRDKYGAFDMLSGFVWRRDAVPIRLDPR